MKSTEPVSPSGATDEKKEQICTECDGSGIDRESAGNHCDKCFGSGTVISELSPEPAQRKEALTEMREAATAFYEKWAADPITQKRWGKDDPSDPDVLEDCDCILVHEFAAAYCAQVTAQRDARIAELEKERDRWKAEDEATKMLYGQYRQEMRKVVAELEKECEIVKHLYGQSIGLTSESVAREIKRQSELKE